MKAVVAAVVAMVIAGGGWLGWNRYESAKETEAAVQAVQVSASQAERQMNARTEDGITFDEYFKRSEAAVESMDKEISSLEALPWNHNPFYRDIAIAFIEQSRALLRFDRADTRLLMQENSAYEEYEDAKKELDEAKSSVARDWALKRFIRKGDDLVEIINKKIISVKERVDKVKKMVAADAAVKSAFGADRGLTQATVEKLEKYVESAKPETPETPEKAGES